MKPRPIPSTFTHETRSLKNITERTSKITGVIVTTTELFIGVDRLRPLKNASILIHIPKKAQAKNRK